VECCTGHTGPVEVDLAEEGGIHLMRQP